jgi:hypothetical protein
MATEYSHPHTYQIQFEGQEYPNIISIESFRTLLEDTLSNMSPQKRAGYIRDRAWLEAIARGDKIPPVAYAGSAASWR